MPTTFLEGLLSGFHHPAVGLDHLAFIVVLGVAGALTRAGTLMIVAFVATAAIGTYGRAVNFDYPYVEQLVAMTVVAAGLLIALGLGAKRLIWLPLALIAGLLHGYAFGEEVLGGDGPVIVAYMIGVTAACLAVALAVMLLSSKVPALSDPGSRVLRIAGALVGVLGIVLLAQLMIEP
jgi:urease accessory protein